MKKRLSIVGIALILAGGLFFLAGLLASAPGASAQTMPPTPMVDRLAPPPTVYPPGQADRGAQAYYQICMACHGDRGQGLTDEWRNVLGPPDNDCWQSGCHHAKHPPGGFVFPKIVPPVVGVPARAPFDTALDLYNYISTRMPFQARGSLDKDMYWDLTAYLLRVNGIDYGNIELNEMTAASIRVNNRPLPTAVPPQPPVIAFVSSNWKTIGAVGAPALLGAALLVFALRRRARS